MEYKRGLYDALFNGESVARICGDNLRAKLFYSQKKRKETSVKMEELCNT